LDKVKGIKRVPILTSQENEMGPFDIIGDVHGCYDELLELLNRLGYKPNSDGIMYHPEGRRVVFVGDLVDRGPKILETVNLAISMIDAKQALCVPGNHDMKLHRYLKGNRVQINHGLQSSIDQLQALSSEEADSWKARYQSFIDKLHSHLVIDGGKLVVAHAGMKEEFHGRSSDRIWSFALYGATTGEVDEYGLPVRLNWAADYRGSATVVYGHTPVAEAIWLNNTINIDTGCVFGGDLTALRWPERELVDVPAHETYAESPRPIKPIEASPKEISTDNLLRIEDVMGKQIIVKKREDIV
jgi:protein phosphatase